MTKENKQMMHSLALSYSRQKYPTLPDHARLIHKYSDTKEKPFIKAVTDFLKFKGHQAERIDNKGTRIDNRKLVTNSLGQMKQIGSVTWHFSQHTKGTADIHASIKPPYFKYAVSVKIEIKTKNDRVRPAQLKYAKSIEDADGIYWLVFSFEEFLEKYSAFMQDC